MIWRALTEVVRVLRWAVARRFTTEVVGIVYMLEASNKNGMAQADLISDIAAGMTKWKGE